MSDRFRQLSTYEGTELVKGAQGKDSSLTRRFIYVVRNDDNVLDGPDLLQAAQDDYINENGYFDPSQQFLPLVQFRARQITKNLIECYATYRGQERPTVGGGTTLANFETVAAPRKVFAHAGEQGDGVYIRGLPFGRLMNGEDIGQNLSKEEITSCPSDVVIHRLVRIKVKRQLFGQNPLAAFSFSPSTTGGGTVAGYNFPSGTLLFEGITTSAATIGTADPLGQTPPELLIYDYEASFLFDPFSFPAQAFNKDGQLQIVNQYENVGWSVFL